MDYFDILLARKLANKGDITTESLSVTQNGTYTAPSGKAYTPVTVEVSPPEDSYQLKSITTPTSLATFEASEMPMPSLKVSVEAKQDLHGYDKPWVGGAGKNKCPINDIDVAANTPDAITDKIPIGNQKTYIISMIIARINGVTILNNALYPMTIATYDSNDEQVDAINSSPITLESGITTFQTSFTVSNNASYMIVNLRNRNGDENKNTRKYNVQLEVGNQVTTFAPYSNICPISGWDEVVVSDVDDVDNPTVTQTTTIPLPQTVYGGEVDVVNGVLKITDGYIASYNGETLPSTWISSMDAYAEGTTPTTGAEVCYELAEPIIINLTPTLIKSLDGLNNLSVDCGDVIEGEYFIKL